MTKKKKLSTAHVVKFYGFLSVLVVFSISSIAYFVISNDRYLDYMGANVFQADEILSFDDDVFDEFDFKDFTVSPFLDVAEGDAHSEAIVALYNAGVLSGDAFSNFRPEEFVTRAEALKMAMEAAKVDLLETEVLTNCFNDVSDLNEQWFAVHVCVAKDQGILDEADDFYPDEFVTKAAALKMVTASFGLKVVNSNDVIDLPYFDVNIDDWYLGLAYSAYVNGIVPGGEVFGGLDKVTRGELAQMIFNVLNN